MNDWEMSRALIADSARRFARETAEHKLTVLHDDGLYRHLRFSSPKNPFYWFELITTPHVLVFRGDGESFVFSRIEDMFDFFRRSGRGADGSIYIQPDYWSQKLESDRDSVREYSPERFDMEAADYLAQVEEDFPGVTAAWTAFTAGTMAEHSTEYKESAAKALRDFEFGELEIKVSCSCGAAFGPTSPVEVGVWKERHKKQHGDYKLAQEYLHPFTIDGAEEWRTHDFGWWFLWACHAIVWGIRQYDAAKAAEPAPAVAVAAEAVAE